MPLLTPQTEKQGGDRSSFLVGPSASVSLDFERVATEKKIEEHDLAPQKSLGVLLNYENSQALAEIGRPTNLPPNGSWYCFTDYLTNSLTSTDILPHEKR